MYLLQFSLVQKHRYRSLNHTGSVRDTPTSMSSSLTFFVTFTFTEPMTCASVVRRGHGSQMAGIERVYCVKSCNSTEGSTTLFTFPKEETLRSKWEKFVLKGNISFSYTPSRSRICKRHFLWEDFVNGAFVKAGHATKLQLKYGAIGYPANLSKSIRLKQMIQAYSIFLNLPSLQFGGTNLGLTQ